MDGKQLSELMDVRWETLQQLLQLGNQQLAAIQNGRMSELMQLLSTKQQPLNRLVEVAEQIRDAAGDDPHQRQWPSEQDRLRCSRRQEECDRMHLELLAIEAQCESQLQQNRESISQELQRLDSAHQAVSSYSDAASRANPGGQLDLSSD